MIDPFDNLRRERAALTAVFARDLRSPLSAIVANLSFLEGCVAESDPEAGAVFGELRVSCDEFQRMVDNGEAIARLEVSAPLTGADPVTDLVPAVRAALTAMSGSAAIAQVDLRTELRTDVALVRAPPVMVELLLRNLFANGITHARRGGWAVLSLHRRADGAVELTLRDPGVPFGDLALTFSRERQAEVKTAHRGRYARGLNPYLLGIVAARLRASVVATHDGSQSELSLTFPPV
jgi:signal transduction histidine kinase